jgi:RNA polymerase sigma-70 factor (ECF subfamily)
MDATTEPRAAGALSDDDVVARVRAGDVGRFEILMRRYNQRLYRTARAVVRDDAEAEDVVQEAYVRAYAHLAQFAGRASFATWLTRIVVHEALARVRRRGRYVDAEEIMPVTPTETPGPEAQASTRELARALEDAIDSLPDAFRAVFMLREVEGLSTAETAACLALNEQTTKTRLHRARTLLREHLTASAQAALPGAFEFAGARCDALVRAVMTRLARTSLS